jgi:hypothetical protein
MINTCVEEKADGSCPSISCLNIYSTHKVYTSRSDRSHHIKISPLEKRNAKAEKKEARKEGKEFN